MSRSRERRRPLPGPAAARSRRAPGLVRWLCCALALLAISGLGQSAHLLLVRHLECGHGALVHAAPPVADHAERLSAPCPCCGTCAEQGLAGVGHEHCSQAMVRAAAVIAPPAASLARQLVWAPVALGRAQRPARPPVALLDLAPKLSPPRLRAL